MIQFHHLHFHYRTGDPVLAGLCFRVEPGEVYGLIGANGAGKSTAISCLLGLLRPARGVATVGGVWLGQAEPCERARAAALLQDAPVDPSLTLDEHAAWLRPWHPRWNESRRRHLADRFRLPPDRALGTLSGGEKRLAAVVLTMAAEPELLVLDEPAANLDPWSRRKLLEELSALLADQPEMAVLYSTHLLADLERLGTRAGWLAEGRLAFELSLDELSTHWRHVTMIFDGPAPADFVLPGNLPATVRGAVVTGIARFASELERELFIASAPGRIEANPVTLEEVFLHWQERAEAGQGSRAAVTNDE